MSPELVETLNGFQNFLKELARTLGQQNYGIASRQIEDMYAKLAVQAAILHADINGMTDIKPVVINCIDIEED